MTRITHTLNPQRKREFAVGDESLEFERGQQVRIIDEGAAEILSEHAYLEIGADVDLPDDYRDLQKMAARVESDEINGNSPKDEIVAYLERLPAETLEGLQDGG